MTKCSPGRSTAGRAGGVTATAANNSLARIVHIVEAEQVQGSAGVKRLAGLYRATVGAQHHDRRGADRRGDRQRLG